jgi:peptidyl-prolyl cis-trans isomerase C
MLLTCVVCSLFILNSGCAKRTDSAASSAPARSDAPSAPVGATVSQTEAQNMNDAVLVTVDGSSLTRGMAANMARQMAARQGVPPQMLGQFLAQMGEQLEKQAVEQFIGRTLVENEVARQDIQVDEKEIDAVVARLTGTLPEGMTIDQALAAQNMELADLRKNIAQGERMRKFYESKTEAVEPVTDAQVEAFYKENTKQFTTEEAATASHILIACDESAEAEAHEKARASAESIRTQIEEGADFAELAKANSSCPSKEKGGLLGSFSRGRMVPEFEKAAFSQEIGKVGPVVKTKFGYHLILVSERKAGGVRSLEDVSKSIREHLESQAKEEVFNAILDALRAKATITYPSGS